MLYRCININRLALAVVYLLSLSGLVSSADASPRSELHRSQAILAINDNRLEDAISLLNQAIKDDPKDTQAVYLRGSVYLRLNQPILARDDFQRVKRSGEVDDQIDKQISLSWILLGRRDYSQGKYQAALDNFRKAASTSPTMAAVAELWQARTLATQGKNKDAIGLLTGALQKTKDDEVLSELRRTLASLTDNDSDKPWRLNLQAGLANDSNIGLFPSGQTIPPGISNRADNRSQLELDTQWVFRHPSDNKTILDYRLFKVDYLTQPGYNLLSQTLSVDHRLRYKSGYWGLNYQYITADMDSFGQQDNQILSGYHTHRFGARYTGLSKVSLSSRTFSYLGYQGYSGLGLEAMYRMYVIGKNWRNKYYYGGVLRQADTDDVQYSNTAIGLEAGLDRVWNNYHYGGSATIETRNYTKRDESNTELKLYGSRDFAHNIKLELGIKAVQNTSSDRIYDYNRNIIYLITGWSQ